MVWSRVFVEGGRLHADIGRATAIEMPIGETIRRWKARTEQWPIMERTGEILSGAGDSAGNNLWQPDL